jgi:hypothetical protein
VACRRDIGDEIEIELVVGGRVDCVEGSPNQVIRRPAMRL